MYHFPGIQTWFEATHQMYVWQQDKLTSHGHPTMTASISVVLSLLLLAPHGGKAATVWLLLLLLMMMMMMMMMLLLLMLLLILLILLLLLLLLRFVGVISFLGVLGSLRVCCRL